MWDASKESDSDGLAAAIAVYLMRIDGGEPVDRESFVAEHPEHAAELRGYFADVDLIQQLAGGSPQLLVDANAATGRFGEYDLLGEIGRGGMGIVYRAKERSTGRYIALKMLLHGSFLSSAEAWRFRNEASTAAALRHRGIIPIYHVGEHRGRLFYTMPLIEGNNLAEQIAKGPLAPATAARFLLAVAEAVAAAHSHGIIHRDLKPANVLLDEHQVPYVADFGLARCSGAEQLGITMTGDLLGTPNYMAPEQVNGHHALVGPLTDVYALGAVLYAMLIGQAPFQSGSVSDTLYKICSVDPVRPRQIRRDVPRDLETICLKCLEKLPAGRYRSAGALADDLRRFLAGEPLLAQPISKIERGRRWFVRNPVVGALAIGIALALVAGTGFSLYYAAHARQGERQALASLYAADMNLAQQHIRSGAIGSALQILEHHRPDFSVRGHTRNGHGIGDSREVAASWEWNYLWHQCHGELRRFEGPHGEVYTATFSPDGRMVAAGGEDRTIWVWETATGSVKFKLLGHTDAVRDLAFAPGGERLATVSNDGTCRVWDLATGTQRATLTEQAKPLTSVAFSGDWRLLATAGSDVDTIDIWELATGKLQQSLQLGPAECVAFAPATVRLAIAGRDGCVRVCECSEGGAWTTKATIRAHADVVRKVAWSPDGTRLATAGSDYKVKTWDTRSWTKLAEVNDFEDAVYCLAFRPDGQRLVMAARNEPIKIWDCTQQQLVAELAGHSALVTSATFCPQGWRLLSASEDGTVRLWDAAQSTDHDCLEGSFSRVRAIDFSPDGTTLASGALESSDIILWDVQASRPRQVLHSQWLTKSDLKFSPNGKYLASVGAGRLQSWNVAARELVLDIEMPGAPLAGVAWAPTGDCIAVQNGDGTILILDAESGVQLSTWRATDRPHGGIAFSPDGSELATTSMDGVVRVWHVATRSLRHELVGHSGPVVCVAFSPQGTVIASSAIDDTIRLWDAKTGRHLRTLFGHSGTPYAIAFHPNSTRLASSSTDRLVKLWDVETGLELQSLAGHKDWGLDVAFSPDGETLASGGGDGAVRIWRAPGQSTDTSEAREAVAVVRHLAGIATAQAIAGQAIDSNTLLRNQREQLASDTTISDAVRTAATAQADGYLLYWLPMCEGNRAAERHDWPQAIAAFERATALAPENVTLWHQLALTSAVGGRADAHERACRELVGRFGGSAKGFDLGNIVGATLLLPPNRRDLSPIKPMVNIFAEQAEIGRVYAVLYDLRMGEKPRESNLVDPRQFTRPPSPEECFIMSMAWARAGDKQRATSSYEVGLQMARRIPPTHWEVRAISNALRREAAEILGIEPVGNGSSLPSASPVAAPPSATPAGEPGESASSAAPK